MYVFNNARPAIGSAAQCGGSSSPLQLPQFRRTATAGGLGDFSSFLSSITGTIGSMDAYTIGGIGLGTIALGVGGFFVLRRLFTNKIKAKRRAVAEENARHEVALADIADKYKKR